MKINIIRLVLWVIPLLLIVTGICFAAEGKNLPVRAEVTAVNQDKAPPTTADPAEGEEINWQVISSGGDIDGSSTNFLLSGTVAQTAVGVGGSDNFGLSHGFWQEFEETICDCRPGDANNDGIANVGDVVYIIAYVFKGGPAPQPYEMCSGDPNGDCGGGVGDAVYLIGYVFKGGPPPVSCEDWVNSCGTPIWK